MDADLPAAVRPGLYPPTSGTDEVYNGFKNRQFNSSCFEAPALIPREQQTVTYELSVHLCKTKKPLACLNLQGFLFKMNCD